MAQPDHRRPVLATIAAVCLIAAGVWWMSADQRSRDAQRLDTLANAVDATAEIEAVNREMMGLRPSDAPAPIRTDPGVPTLPIGLLIMTGVLAGLAAIAVRPGASRRA